MAIEENETSTRFIRVSRCRHMWASLSFFDFFRVASDLIKLISNQFPMLTYRIPPPYRTLAVNIDNHVGSCGFFPIYPFISSLYPVRLVRIDEETGQLIRDQVR